MQGNEEKKLSSLSERFLNVLSVLEITGYRLKQDGVINSEPTLTKIKQGKQQPSRKTIAALCDTYGVNESWLHTGVSIHALTWRATLVNKTYSLTSYYNIQNANIHKILLNKKYGTLFLVPTI